MDHLVARRHLNDWALLGARLLIWPLVAIMLTLMALRFGASPSEYRIAGPFAAETDPARHSLMLEVPREARAPWWRQPLLGDSDSRPDQSILGLSINGQRMGPPHSLEEVIRSGRTTGFRHVGPLVIFSLPQGMMNGPETIATLRYNVQPRPWLILTLAALTALLVRLLYVDRLRSLLARFRAKPRAILLGTPYALLFLLCVTGLAFCAAYVVSSVYALATGWALPTTALIQWSSATRWAAEHEPHFAYLLLMLAGLGTMTTWLAGESLPNILLLQANERSLTKLLLWSGIPIAACAFILCISTMWTGILRAGDLHYSSIGGLVPFSDAGYYLATAFDQLKDGVWNTIALRRPLAASFRTVLLVLSGLSLPTMLILQACAIALAACFATAAVIAWRGVWAGLTFFALTYIYARIFVPTTLTETLGMFWAVMSIPFFIEAFRNQSAMPALVAFTMTSVAQVTRPGAVFVLPALLIWLVWQFGERTAAKLRVCVAGLGILLGVFGVNSLLQDAYGTGASSRSGNFAYVLCGLSMGTTWDGCLKRLVEKGTPLQGSEAEQTTQLYAAAWKQLHTDVTPFLSGLGEGMVKFVTENPSVIWRGAGKAVREPAWLLTSVLAAVSLIGLFYGLIGMKAVERSFWILFSVGVVASSAIVYLDEGARTLATTHPLIALLLAFGMSNHMSAPASPPARSQLSKYGLAGLILAVVLLTSTPWLAHRFSSNGAMASLQPLTKSNEVIVFGGRQIAGFLVIDDHSSLRHDVPSMRLADFEAIIAQSGVEESQDLIHPILPSLPFGFVFAPRLEKNSSIGPLYLVPAEVIEHREVAAWRFAITPWGTTRTINDGYWSYVTKAEPWQPTALHGN